MASYATPKNCISDLPLDTPLWCVYGMKCSPSILACVIKKDMSGEKTIWGYSIYKKQPGYRTLGQHLKAWLNNEFHQNAFFFTAQADAIAYLSALVTPVQKCY